MLGIRQQNTGINRAAALNLDHLRRSVVWSSADSRKISPVLGLESMLILELPKEGGRQYLSLTVRGLYNHVMKSITKTKLILKQKKSEGDLKGLDSPKGSLDELPSMETLQPPRRNRQQSISYRDRLGGYLHPRDMRRLVTPFSASNQPELMVRRHVMLLNFDPLRAIILRDRLLVIVPSGADSMLVQLEKAIRGEHLDEEWLDCSEHTIPEDTSSKHNGIVASAINKTKKLLKPKSKSNHPPSQHSSHHDGETTSTEDSHHHSQHDAVMDHQDEWDEMNNHDWAALPFELRCMDAVLRVVGSLLTEDTFELQEASSQYIHRLLEPTVLHNDDPLTIIRAVKDAVREMCSRVNGYMSSLNTVLDDDEDMALMNLSRLLTHPERFVYPVTPEILEAEADEPELILEAHLQTALTLNNSLDLIQGQIDTAADLVDQKLDAVRNRLLYVNMLISIISLCVTCAGLVGSMFGMNLTNHLEENEHAFIQITFGTLGGSVVFAVMIVSFLVHSGTIPKTSFRN